MNTTITDRKEPMENPEVKRLIEELKTAMLAVNGDKEVKSLIIYADVSINDLAGTAVVNLDICNCQVCLKRAADVLAIAFGKADEMHAEELKRRAAEPRATQH